MISPPMSDESWLVLDLLIRAKAKGVTQLNRLELLNATAIPVPVRLRLTMAALLMPKDLVRWVSQHDFEITPEGEDVYRREFGRQQPRPNEVADSVICLPGPEHSWN